MGSIFHIWCACLTKKYLSTPLTPLFSTFCKLSTILNVCLMKCSPSEKQRRFKKNQLNFQINVLVIRTLTKNIQKLEFFRELRCHFFKDFSHVECKLFQHSVENSGNFTLTLFWQKFRESNVFTGELISRKEISVRVNYSFSTLCTCSRLKIRQLKLMVTNWFFELTSRFFSITYLRNHLGNSIAIFVRFISHWKKID